MRKPVLWVSDYVRHKHMLSKIRTIKLSSNFFLTAVGNKSILHVSVPLNLSFDAALCMPVILLSDELASAGQLCLM